MAIRPRRSIVFRFRGAKLIARRRDIIIATEEESNAAVFAGYEIPAVCEDHKSSRESNKTRARARARTVHITP